mmetsp:Transcript_32871/g.84567  ORF Transcript_32871/g.84567 Transcript_32871/m.84567 type:complete len:255 (-) Transcript_32871:56-820(-)|eukprot:CAMPEP_0183389668 /NCGR_PEP_ID=MMETSP0370-20130417/5065_1 /TAXON_ID=268820 /ORGANISM="Peridinium aciculiferum, Strain PAER-2" /LENGTH=254 /DNA_ID=CAMNT_0025568961 /DNA_START=44 /DNA_END=805 /DNA_ORIENTATION=+
MAARSSVLVFGGRGFVGAAVARELAKRGASPVLSVARSDRPGAGGELGPGVEHRSGVDALQPETYKSLLAEAKAVVISIGEAPWAEQTGGSKDQAIKMNGLSNIAVLRAAAEQKVPKIVLVNATMPSWGLLQGYREGKEMAEAEARLYPETSGLGPEGCSVLILKPGVVAGTKYWGSMPVPMGLAMAPMRLALRCFSGPCNWLEAKMPGVFGGVLKPAVWVDELAQAAADTVQGSSFKGVQVLTPDSLVGYKAA